jgi:hypothetical protein
MGVAWTGTARGHDAPHRSRAPAETRIDPRIAYPARLVAAGGGHFHAILVGARGNWLLAGTHLGLFRSVDRGLTWRLVAPRFSGEDVHALVRDPATGRIHAVTHGQGLLTSADDGRGWREDSGDLPSRDLHALALDPHQPDRLYVWAVGSGLLARSGTEPRWHPIAPVDPLGDVRALAVDPKDARRLYAATATGVWLSRDGGHHWEQPPDALRIPSAGLATIPTRDGALIAATEDGVFVGDAMASRWRPAAAAPRWWGTLVAFTLAPDGRDVIALSHEVVVARRPLDGGQWKPLSETSGEQASRQQ